MVEFIEDTHQYLVDGILVPSVSELVAYALGGEGVESIPESVLQKAGEFGTRIHSMIQEAYFELNNWDFKDEEEKIYNDFIKLAEKNNIGIYEMEQIVYTDDYAGRYDILGSVKGKEALIDIKTNRVYPKEHLELQLGFYLKALKKDIDCYCLWLDKSKMTWKLKKVNPISNEKCEEILNAYKNNLKAPQTINEVIEVNIYTPEEIAQLERFYALEKTVKEIKKRGDEIVINELKNRNLKSIKQGNITFTLTDGYTSRRVDSDKLKADGLYDSYTKEVYTKESLKVKLNV